jgi:hypothetical protein
VPVRISSSPMFFYCTRLHHAFFNPAGLVVICEDLF